SGDRVSLVLGQHHAVVFSLLPQPRTEGKVPHARRRMTRSGGRPARAGSTTRSGEIGARYRVATASTLSQGIATPSFILWRRSTATGADFVDRTDSVPVWSSTMRPCIVVAAVVALAVSAGAADQTILGKQLQVKDPKPGVDATKRKGLGQGKEENSPNTIVGDPTMAGARRRAPH